MECAGFDMCSEYVGKPFDEGLLSFKLFEIRLIRTAASGSFVSEINTIADPNGGICLTIKSLTTFDWMPDNIRNEIGHFNLFRLEPYLAGHG